MSKSLTCNNWPLSSVCNSNYIVLAGNSQQKGILTLQGAALPWWWLVAAMATRPTVPRWPWGRVDSRDMAVYPV